MSTFFAILALLLTAGMIFTVIYFSAGRKCVQMKLSAQELREIMENIPESAVINITYRR